MTTVVAGDPSGRSLASATGPVALAVACDRRIDRALTIVAIVGDDDLSRRLQAAGLWPGAQIECIGRALFGDPLLFRVHGYRLALRRSEAERVRVVEQIG